MKKIIVIVVSYNGSGWIRYCLSSLLNSNVRCDIMVVDNASTDNTVDIITRDFGDVLLIKNTKNLGFGLANNLGLNYAIANNYDFVFLINQDVAVLADSIAKIIELFEAEPLGQVGLISPLHLNWDGNDLERGFNQFIREGIDERWFGDVLLNRQEVKYKIDFVNAAAWCIPVPVLKQIGGFDPLFSHYCEDNDWVNRLKLKGFSVYITTYAKIMHSSNFKNWEQIKNDSNRIRLIYFSRIKNLEASLMSNLIMLFKSELEYVLTLLINRQFRTINVVFKSLFLALVNVPRIIKSRNLSKRESAFLNVG